VDGFSGLIVLYSLRGVPVGQGRGGLLLFIFFNNWFLVTCVYECYGMALLPWGGLPLLRELDLLLLPLFPLFLPWHTGFFFSFHYMYHGRADVAGSSKTRYPVPLSPFSSLPLTLFP